MPGSADILPIHDVLDALKASLAERSCAVLVARPGRQDHRGSLALLDQPWTAGGKIIVLEPRRLAARAAAERMAKSLGERAGTPLAIVYGCRPRCRPAPGSRW